jgi:uncharacterized membrane protein YccC
MPDANPALLHIRRMELRIEQQTHSIERLRQSGEDTSAAVQRLKLLRHALDEMRIQLGQLSPGDRAARPLETFRPRLVT